MTKNKVNYPYPVIKIKGVIKKKSLVLHERMLNNVKNVYFIDIAVNRI